MMCILIGSDPLSERCPEKGCHFVMKAEVTFLCGSHLLDSQDSQGLPLHFLFVH